MKFVNLFPLKSLSILVILFFSLKNLASAEYDESVYDVSTAYPVPTATPVPTLSPTKPLPTAWPTPEIGSSTHPCSEDSRSYTYSEKVDTTYLPGLKIVYLQDLKFVTVVGDTIESTYTILLYHCHMPDHETLRGIGYDDIREIYQIPFNNVAYTQTSYSHALELLNLRSAATVSVTPLMWNTSPCFIQLYSNGYIINAYDPNLREINHLLKENDVDATFSSHDEVEQGIYRGVPVPSQWLNSTALEEAESMLKFMSVFFNAEDLANNVVQELTESYYCSSRIGKNSAWQKNYRGKSVMWCDYAGKHPVALFDVPPWEAHLQSQYAVENLWKCSKCPGKECSVIMDSGAKFLDYTSYSSTTTRVNDTEYLTSTQFMEMAIYADYWITTGDTFTDFNVTLSNLMAEDTTLGKHAALPLSQVPAVSNRRVFDWKLKGAYKFVQESLIEPDGVIQDLASMQRKVNHNRLWLRNIFTDKIKFDIGKCSGNPWSSQDFQSTDCDSFSYESGYIHKISGLSRSEGQTETVGVVLTQLALACLTLGGFGLLASLIYHIMVNKHMAGVAARKALGKDAKRMNTSISGSKRGRKKKPSTVAEAMSSILPDKLQRYECASSDSMHFDQGQSSSSVHSNVTVEAAMLPDSLRDSPPKAFFTAVAPFKKQPPVVPSVAVRKTTTPPSKTNILKSWSVST